MYARAAHFYRQVHLESASPPRLLDELFVRLRADLDEAERLIGARDAGGKGEALNHALAILSTLKLALDHAASPALCADLSRLYDFASARLTEANTRFDAAPIAGARSVITVLHEGFTAASAARR